MKILVAALLPALFFSTCEKEKLTTSTASTCDIRGVYGGRSGSDSGSFTAYKQ